MIVSQKIHVLELNSEAAASFFFLPIPSVTDAITAINVIVLGDSPAETMGALKSEFAAMSSLDDSSAERYHAALRKAREEKGEVRIPY